MKNRTFMNYLVGRQFLVRVVLGIVATTLPLLTGCGYLPNSGPGIGKNGQVEGVQIIMLDALSVKQFAPRIITPDADNLQQPAAGATSAIQHGDLLTVSIFEASTGWLFKSMQTDGNIFSLRVDSKGSVTVPFLGEVNVGGKIPAEVEQIIVSGLRAQSLSAQPAVLVTIAMPAATVEVSGDVRSPGSYALSPSASQGAPPPRTALEAINRAGGPAQDSTESDVLLRRGNKLQILPMEDMLVGGNDPVLLPGDRIVVHHNPRYFVAMGAVTHTGLFNFETRNPSLLEALAQAGGMLDARADPGRVFVFRSAPDKRSILFALDMSKAEGVFVAARFGIEPGDAVYVTNAEIYQASKVLRTLMSGSSAVIEAQSAVNVLP